MKGILKVVLLSALSFSCLGASAKSSIALTPNNKPYLYNTLPQPVLMNTWYVAIGWGGTFPESSSNPVSFVTLGGGLPPDRYRANEIDQTTSQLVSAGYVWNSMRRALPLLSLGLEYSFIFPTKVRGEIDQFSMVTFRNYDYEYRFHVNRVLVISRLGLYRLQKLIPYVVAGIGIAIHDVGSYQEFPKPNIMSRFAPGFISATKRNFTYTFGAGLRFIISKNINLSIVYRFDCYGDIQTGVGVNTFAGDKIGHKIYANNVILHFIYLI